MITPILKDTILKDLVAKTPSMQLSGDFKTEAELHNIDKEVYKAILNQFNKKGFITLRSFVRGTFYLTVKTEAHDYILAGGHIGEVEMLELEFKKLETELYSLEKNLDHQKFERLKGHLDTIATYWGSLLILKS